MYCENCGKKIEKDSKFCTGCGCSVDGNKKNNNVKRNNGLRIASIVLGILGIISGVTLIFSIFGLIMSIVGLILGICALKKGKNVLGIVLNIIGMVLSILVIVLVILIGSSFYFFSLTVDDEIEEMVEMHNEEYDFSSVDLDSLYNNNVSLGDVLNNIDKIILNKKYVEDDEMNEMVDDTAEYYYDICEQYYDYSKDECLSSYGFMDEDKFIDYLKLEYLRNKYFEEYVRDLITDFDIVKYYKDNVFGDVDSKHILVFTGEEGLSEVEAKKLALEIISKLDDGMTWEDVINKYEGKIISEDLGYQSYDALLEDAYLEECKNLKVGEYSSEPILTSYGYHIVYKIDQKEKPSIDDERDNIIEVLSENMVKENTNLYYEALIFMREESGFSFDGTVYEELYNQYVEEYK